MTPGASSGAWTVVTDQAYEGANSLGSAKVVSPVFNTPVNSDMTFVGDFVTGRIAFAYRISSYQEYGTFEFSIDGVAVVTDSGGESGWKIVSVPITAGSRTLRWRFTNLLNAPCNAGWDPPPAGGASCADRVWIDALSLSNNPVPFLSFAQPTYSVTEGTPSVTIDVTRTVETAGAASVNYATANGTAIAGTHYTATSGTFNWADADGSTRQIVVPITNDAIVNGSRTFTVNLSGAVGGNAGSPTTVTIADDDNTIQFASATATTVEGQPSVIVTVTRTGSTAFAASADWSTADGTALAGTDFGVEGNTAQVTGTVSWAAGNSATQNISVPLLNDAIQEPTKTFTINLGNPTGTGASIGSIPTKTVTSERRRGGPEPLVRHVHGERERAQHHRHREPHGRHDQRGRGHLDDRQRHRGRRAGLRHQRQRHAAHGHAQLGGRRRGGQDLHGRAVGSDDAHPERHGPLGRRDLHDHPLQPD